MSSSASMQKLMPGTTMTFINERQTAVELVCQGEGLTIRTRLAIGQSITIEVGNNAAMLCLFEPEAPEHALSLVRTPAAVAPSASD